MTKGSLPGACAISTPPGWPKLPAAATTTMPWNQSCSTAASSGSLTKLDCASLTSEKFATRMLYVLWCWRIQSHAAITSLMCDAPFAFAVRMLTMGAVGTTPGYAADAPAAMPATIVPWPSLSPVAFGLSELRLTLATIREPKSAVFVASTPLSTMAIAGRFAPPLNDRTAPRMMTGNVCCGFALAWSRRPGGVHAGEAFEPGAACAVCAIPASRAATATRSASVPHRLIRSMLPLPQVVGCCVAHRTIGPTI